MTVLQRLFNFLSSYALATALLVLLFVYTLLGTLEQVEHGLYLSQLKYFESVVITQIDLGACLRALNFPTGDMKLPVLLPGGYTVMALFCLNIIVGGVIRIRKKPRTIGVVISHFSMAFMILAGGVSMHTKIEGNLSLLEGQTDDQFVSVDSRVVEIEQVEPAAAGGKRKVLVISDSQFSDLAPDGSSGKARQFTSAELPFDLTLQNYAPNAQIKRDDGADGRRDVVDGYFIQALPKDPEHGQNMPALHAIAKNKKTGETQQGILWLRAAAPWTVKMEEKTYTIDLTRRSWVLPFAVKLEKATREFHPGTQRPRKFESIVTKLQDGKEERKEIKMNEPLRTNGFTLFQHQMMSGEDLKRTENASVFQVVSNPADQWPLWSCIAVAFGLLLHFSMMLARNVGWNEWLVAGIVVGVVSAYFILALVKMY
ncbi:MAG: cytochrome c biogenesis protein ResB [Verrucomicrobiaceae bacterium]|nr:cytochrome c biogenesis protein ResB [Verrucomicrobiaceae bacterium]